MSESDSDLEFQSADEDTIEHNLSEKNSVSETTTNIPEVTSDTAVTTVTSEDISIIPLKNASEENALNSKLRNIKISDYADEEDEGSNKQDKEENKITKADICTSISGLSNKQENEEKKIVTVDDICKSTDDGSIKKDEEKKVIKEDVVKSTPETSSEVGKSKQESQRIPLRLEKKIQQKTQSRESSVEKSETACNYREQELASNSSATSVDTEKSYSWGFSSWGSSLLSTAASSVSTFSSQVSQGIGTVFETVESTLGAPSPEELASILKEKKDQIDDNVAVENENKEEEVGSGILPDVSSWTKVFESTSSKVIMGGLDTLELIGKKTMDILTEGDPRLMNKRHAFSDTVNLSQILREAKENAEKQAEKEGSESSDIINYSQVFDDQQGLVHLEALEMLSKQSQATFQRLFMRHSKKTEIKKRLEEIKSICENIPPVDDPADGEGFDDFESVFKKHALELNLPLNVDNIVKTQKQLSSTVSKYENKSEEPCITPDEIYWSSICSLADFTARCIETFHKIAELVLVQPNLGPDIEQCATNFTGLTTVMCIEINNLSSRYHKCLDSFAEQFSNYTNSQGLNITGMVTNLYVEASNSNKYIQDAFQMLVPVLQVCLLESLDK